MSDNWVMGGDREEYNTAPVYEIPPEDVYVFELVDKDPDQPQDPLYDKTGTKMRARFHFIIVDDEDWEGHKVGQFYNLTLNEKSNWLPVVEALLGRTLGAKEKVGLNADPDNGVTGLKGLRMKAMLKHNVKEDGSVWPKLSSPMPNKARAPRASKAAAAIPESVTEQYPVDGEVPF